jgi:hypothetical protein
MHLDRPQFVLCPQPHTQPGQTTQAACERKAEAYWNSLTSGQESWGLKKTGFSQMGFAGQSSVRINDAAPQWRISRVLTSRVFKKQKRRNPSA